MQHALPEFALIDSKTDTQFTQSTLHIMDGEHTFTLHFGGAICPLICIKSSELYLHQYITNIKVYTVEPLYKDTLN